ncbi:MAG TPA: class D sortase [Acidimicrobiales bacterium]|nr:class D sortase [Acidimicrobiales bacterium]
MIGVALVWGALGLVGYATGWQSHKRQAQGSLLSGERSVIKKAAAHHPTTPCLVTSPQTGQLSGILRIPALNLTAPVEEGTGDTELDVAVGHDTTSVWPGESGTAVFLAHDVSYFVHLNQLQAGDQIIYKTACNSVTYTVSGQQVVQQGAAVANSTTPTIVLDTCYPPNALFFTTQRLLVTADESTGTGTGTGSAGGSATGAGPLVMPAEDQVSYSVPAPPDLVAEGLTLEQNEAPMGTMTLAGQTSPTWEQSPGPLALEAAALEAYFGGLHATGQLRPDWWSAIATTSPPGPLQGATVTGHDTPLDVEIDSIDGVVSEVVLRTTVTVSGGPSPGTYAETVTTPVQGSTVRIGSWTLTPS